VYSLLQIEMAYRTFVARAVDGFPLLEAPGEADYNGRATREARRQAHEWIGCLHRVSPQCSVDVARGFVCHLRLLDGICYMGLFCQSYPRKAAFAFLEDVIVLFQDEFKQEFGMFSVDYRSHIDLLTKPYNFARFERQITKVNLQFRDPSSSTVLHKLQTNSVGKSHIMNCSLQHLHAGGLETPKPAQAIHPRGSHLGCLTLLAMLACACMAMGVLTYAASEYNLLGEAMCCSSVIVGLVLGKACVAHWHGKPAATGTATKCLLAFAGEYGEHLHVL